MSKIKATLMGLGISGAITLITLGSIPNAKYPVNESPCPKKQVQVWVNKQSACIYDTYQNRKKAMYAEILKTKTNKDGKKYDVEIANWGVFWKTLDESAKKKGLTSEELKTLIDNNKKEIINLLKP